MQLVNTALLALLVLPAGAVDDQSTLRQKSWDKARTAILTRDPSLLRQVIPAEGVETVALVASPGATPSGSRVKADELISRMEASLFDDKTGTFGEGPADRVFAFTWVALKHDATWRELQPNTWEIVSKENRWVSKVTLQVRKGRTYITRMVAWVSGD